MSHRYLSKYKKDEPVNDFVYTKKRRVTVTLSDRFLDKVLVDEGIKDLPEKYRVPLVLFYVEDVRAKRIAERLGIGVTTVYRRLRRGEHMLQEILDKNR